MFALKLLSKVPFKSLSAWQLGADGEVFTPNFQNNQWDFTFLLIVIKDDQKIHEQQCLG
jgi:hypothetical protein